MPFVYVLLSLLVASGLLTYLTHEPNNNIPSQAEPVKKGKKAKKRKKDSQDDSWNDWQSDQLTGDSTMQEANQTQPGSNTVQYSLPVQSPGRVVHSLPE